MTENEDDIDPDDLPDTAFGLYEIATDESAFPYKRETAIKRLGTTEVGREYLLSLESGEALSIIEQSLAGSVLAD